MLQRIVPLMLCIMLASCCLFQQRTSLPPVNDDPLVVIYEIDHNFNPNHYGEGWNIYLKIEEWSDEMPGVVQELHLPDGETLVEYFDTPNGIICNRDKHSSHGKNIGSSKRYIYTYPAKTEDMDKTWTGFGELPSNMDGSVTTTTDPEHFNRNHNYYTKNDGKDFILDEDGNKKRRHERKGRIVEQQRDRGIWWSVEYIHHADKDKRQLILRLNDRP